jgi:CxxC motif-containing protein (DUF1111 family)
MTARTLRVLVAVLIVGVVFIYLASVQMSDNLPIKAVDEGKPGGPVAGLTKRQLERFYRCKKVFQKVFEPQDGLGPLFNESSCAQCHGGANSTGAAGSDEGRAIWIARRAAKDGKQALIDVKDKLKVKDVDFLAGKGGPILQRNSITNGFPKQMAELKVPADCKIDPVVRPPAEAEIVSNRVAASLYGLGFLDAVSDLDLSSIATMQAQKKTAIKGQCSIPSTEVIGLSRIGRFGSKAQEATLLMMCAKELNNHLGLTSSCDPHSRSTTGIDNLPSCIKSVGPADPNVDGKVLAQIVYYISLLAPPQRPAEIKFEANQGERVFNKLNCAACHVPLLRTNEKIFVVDPDGPPLEFQEKKTTDGRVLFELRDEWPQQLEIRAMEGLPVSAYTDLLVHDMGKALADGIPSGTVSGGQWRTAPLWGCKLRKSYLHDGRANTLDAAITMHGGEASECSKNYAKLPQHDKDNLVKFLESL